MKLTQSATYLCRPTWCSLLDTTNLSAMTHTCKVNLFHLGHQLQRLKLCCRCFLHNACDGECHQSLYEVETLYCQCNNHARDAYTTLEILLSGRTQLSLSYEKKCFLELTHISSISLSSTSSKEHNPTTSGTVRANPQTQANISHKVTFRKNT